MPESELHYGLVWRTDGGTYDWQMADRSREERDTVVQHNTALAGDGTSSIHATTASEGADTDPELNVNDPTTHSEIKS